MALSPDCRDGNHHKCNGIAWDDAADLAVECNCQYCAIRSFD